MVEVEAHRQLEGQEVQNLEQHLHLVAEQLVACSTGSMQHSSGNLHKRRTDLVHRSTEHIERSSQSGCWLLEALELLELQLLVIEPLRSHRNHRHSLDAHHLLADLLADSRSRVVGVGSL